MWPTGRIKQVASLREPGWEPSCVYLLWKEAGISLAICTRPRKTHSAFDPALPRETRSRFTTFFHCFPLVSIRRTGGTDKSTECREDTSEKNESSQSTLVFLANGQQAQHPSVLSLSAPDSLVVHSRQRGCSHTVISCYATKRVLKGGIGSHFPMLFYEKSHSHLGFFQNSHLVVIYNNKPIQ